MKRMPIPIATQIEASERTKEILEGILRRRNAPLWLIERVEIIIEALKGKSNTQIAAELDVGRGMVTLWRGRWKEQTEGREALEAEGAGDKELEAYIIEGLRDAYRSGAPPKFSAEQVVRLVAIACEDPQASGYPISHWTPKEIAAEAVKRGIVESISVRQVGRFLKRSGYSAAPEPLLAEYEGRGPGSFPGTG
jgi:putative transposase